MQYTSNSSEKVLTTLENDMVKAVENENVKRLEELIEKGGDVDTFALDGQCILEIACRKRAHGKHSIEIQNKKTACLKLLIKRGANVYNCTDRCKIALVLSSKTGTAFGVGCVLATPNTFWSKVLWPEDSDHYNCLKSLISFEKYYLGERDIPSERKGTHMLLDKYRCIKILLESRLIQHPEPSSFSVLKIANDYVNLFVDAKKDVLYNEIDWVGYTPPTLTSSIGICLLLIEYGFKLSNGSKYITPIEDINMYKIFEANNDLDSGALRTTTPPRFGLKERSIFTLKFLIIKTLRNHGNNITIPSNYPPLLLKYNFPLNKDFRWRQKKKYSTKINK